MRPDEVERLVSHLGGPVSDGNPPRLSLYIRGSLLQMPPVVDGQKVREYLSFNSCGEQGQLRRARLGAGSARRLSAVDQYP